MLIASGPFTTTLAVAEGIPVADNVTVVVPRPTLVMRAPTLLAAALSVTNGGTVATAVLLDCRFTTMPPAGAGPDSVTVITVVWPVPTIVTGEGDVDRVNPTFTVEVAGASPGAETVTDVEPAAMPLTLTGVLDVVCPAEMEIVAGVIVATPVLAELNDSTTVLVAGFTRVIG